MNDGSEELIKRRKQKILSKSEIHEEWRRIRK